MSEPTLVEAHVQQEALRTRVVTVDDHPPVVTAAGLDVAYDVASDRAAAAIVVLDVATLTQVDAAVVTGRTTFPYAPGLLAFREIPLLMTAYEKLSHVPDVLVCDGHGIAHPRRIGLASHLGVLLDRPSVGVAKTPYLGMHAPLDESRGASADIVDAGEVIGRALRTRDGVAPVYVSVGHRVALDTACALVLHLASRYRQPETTRQADSAARAALKRLLADTRGDGAG